MSPIYLRLPSGGPQEVQVAVMSGSETVADASVADVDAELISELIAQHAHGTGNMHAANELATRLGRVLFAGDVGNELRRLLEQSEGAGLFLQAEGGCADWPWELAIDSKTGLRPALTIGMVRRGGRLTEGLVLPRQGLLVLPRSAGQARVKAVRASTRPLARRHDIDLYPADPATGPGVRQSLENGALLVHIEGMQGEGAVLDDGQVPLHRLGLNDRVWLATLSGQTASLPAMRSLLDGGVHLVVGFQFPLAAHQTSAFFRALWQGLASGDSGVGRFEARLHSQLDGDASASWSSPVVFAAGDRRNEPALESFPPLLSRRRARLKVGVDAASEGLNSRGRQAQIGSPIAAPVFVRNTLRRLMTGLASSSETEQRSEALRHLGRTLQDAPVSGAPNEKIQLLTDRLVDSMGRADSPPAC